MQSIVSMVQLGGVTLGRFNLDRSIGSLTRERGDWVRGSELEPPPRVMNGGDDDAVSAPAGPPQPLEWKFSQVFGERSAGEEDLVIILLLVTVGVEWFSLRGPPQRIMMDQEEIWTGWTTKLVSTLSSDTKIEFLTHEHEVQEKKVKKISDMNMDPLKALGNGSVASLSNSSSTKPHLANVGYADRSNSSSTVPPGGTASLRLPMLWDINMASGPVAMIKIHQYLRPKRSQEGNVFARLTFWVGLVAAKYIGSHASTPILQSEACACIISTVQIRRIHYEAWCSARFS